MGREGGVNSLRSDNMLRERRRAGALRWAGSCFTKVSRQIIIIRCTKTGFFTAASYHVHSITIGPSF